MRMSQPDKASSGTDAPIVGQSSTIDSLPGGMQLKFTSGAAFTISAERKRRIDQEREAFKRSIEAEVSARLQAQQRSKA